MTKQRLQKLRHYDSELKLLREHLRKLEAQIGISAMIQDGQPKSTKVGSPTEQQAIAMADTIMQIRELEERISIERDEVWKYISSLDDPLMRQIIILRFIDGKSWFKVSEKIGGDTTDESCRKAFERFLI